jgi:hypothetical protein
MNVEPTHSTTDVEPGNWHCFSSVVCRKHFELVKTLYLLRSYYHHQYWVYFVTELKCPLPLSEHFKKLGRKSARKIIFFHEIQVIHSLNISLLSQKERKPLFHCDSVPSVVLILCSRTEISTQYTSSKRMERCSSGNETQTIPGSVPLKANV